MTISLRIPSLSAVIAAVGLLSACGGGGGSSVATPTVTGTAATGVAIASGTITLKCVGGTSSVVTTNIDGSFTIDVGSVTFPCVGRVDYKESGTGTARKLHTFVKAAGTANITPVTELLLASLTGAAATKAFDNFDGTAVKGYTAAQIKAALDAVKAYLQTVLGVDVTNLGDDPIGTKFVAKTAGGNGDKFDDVLDDLKVKLDKKGKKLDDAENDVDGSASTGSAVGCTGKVAALFNKAKGNYSSAAAIYLDPSDHSGMAAGFVNGTTYTVAVAADCSIDVGPSHHFTVKDGSYAESTDSSGTQFDIDMTSSGLTNAHFELFTNNKRALGFSDPMKPSTVRLDE